ncbi:MAG: hypothetical protein PHT59_07525, partial [Candidatus Omnitrophica bacterium]|nr:hypothetical protein [Candidatus Omnitrophota bacterium]
RWWGKFSYSFVRPHWAEQISEYLKGKPESKAAKAEPSEVVTELVNSGLMTHKDIVALHNILINPQDEWKTARTGVPWVVKITDILEARKGKSPDTVGFHTGIPEFEHDTPGYALSSQIVWDPAAQSVRYLFDKAEKTGLMTSSGHLNDIYHHLHSPWAEKVKAYMTVTV